MTTRESLCEDRAQPPIQRLSIVALLPPLLAIIYPFLLMAFHSAVANPGAVDLVVATVSLLGAFVVPLVGLIVAGRADTAVSMRRLAYASVTAPSLYVFLGVVQALLGSTLSDPLVWCVLWLCLTLGALRGARAEPSAAKPVLGRWRVAHGVSALILSSYVLFHLGNHLMGLAGPELHAEVMAAGRTVYRAAFIEPLLVLAFIFQVCSGLYLAWRWSATWHGWLGTFQIASGVYLSVFVLGHMNSVFIYARTFLGIPTDWNFATGAPAGLLLDPWNIRLVPHYTLGVFLVLAHLLAGLRIVLEAHGVGAGKVRKIWYLGLAGCALVSLAIIAGMCGVRI